MYPQSTRFPRIYWIFYIYNKALHCVAVYIWYSWQDQSRQVTPLTLQGQVTLPIADKCQVRMRSVIMSTDKFNFLPQVITVSLGLLDIHTGKVLWISKSSHVMYWTVLYVLFCRWCTGRARWSGSPAWSPRCPPSPPWQCSPPASTAGI